VFVWRIYLHSWVFWCTWRIWRLEWHAKTRRWQFATLLLFWSNSSMTRSISNLLPRLAYSVWKAEWTIERTCLVTSTIELNDPSILVRVARIPRDVVPAHCGNYLMSSWLVRYFLLFFPGVRNVCQRSIYHLHDGAVLSLLGSHVQRYLFVILRYIWHCLVSESNSLLAVGRFHLLIYALYNNLRRNKADDELTLIQRWQDIAI